MFSVSISRWISRYRGPTGAGTLNQGGLRPRCGWTPGPRMVRTSAMPPGLALDRVALGGVAFGCVALTTQGYRSALLALRCDMASPTHHAFPVTIGSCRRLGLKR